MTDKIVPILLFLVGIINLFPLIVFFDAGKTAKLYGVPIDGESLTILMRHRGVLLSIVGLGLLIAAFKSEYIVFAVALALISKITFTFLVFSGTNITSEVQKVAWIDVGSTILLLIALGLYFYSK